MGGGGRAWPDAPISESRYGRPVVWLEKQIPRGNDRKNGKGKSKCACRSLHFASQRQRRDASLEMTEFGQGCFRVGLVGSGLELVAAGWG